MMMLCDRISLLGQAVTAHAGSVHKQYLSLKSRHGTNSLAATTMQTLRHAATARLTSIALIQLLPAVCIYIDCAKATDTYY
jgi:hypothetical protein